VTTTDTHGRRGGPRWLTVRTDDTQLQVTALERWNITDEVTLSGSTAVTLLPRIIEGLMTHERAGATWFYDATERSYTSIPHD
jgi:hypothetical protein